MEADVVMRKIKRGIILIITVSKKNEKEEKHVMGEWKSCFL